MKHRRLWTVLAFVAFTAGSAATAPAVHAATFVVSNTADSGAGSLHQAILDANASAGADVISFDPATNGVPILDVDLPQITESITIQGNGVGQTIIETVSTRAIDIEALAGGMYLVADLTLRGQSGFRAGVAPATTASITLQDVQVENGGTILVQSSGTTTVALTRVDVVTNSQVDLQGPMTATMTDSRIENSFRDALIVQGGGASLTIDRSLIANIDDDGLNVLRGASLIMRNSTVTGISDGQDAILVDGSATLVNVTMSGIEGFGILGVGDGDSPVSLTNTIIDGTDDDSCSPSLLITSGGGNITDDATCGLTQAGDLQNAVVSLGSLADNGGRTRTILPLAGSPAIDGGVANGCPAVDQRGLARPADGNGDSVAVCDSGAVEVAAVQATTTTTTTTTTTVSTTTTTTVAPTTTAPVATTAPTTAAPTVTAAPVLPATGSAQSSGIGLLAAALVALGAVVLLTATRRRPAR